jgi:hypothetical protein
VQIKDANQLLSAFYLPLESGWKRLDTGVINIAVRQLVYLAFISGFNSVTLH